jgi:hypothetical protein
MKPLIHTLDRVLTGRFDWGGSLAGGDRALEMVAADGHCPRVRADVLMDEARRHSDINIDSSNIDSRNSSGSSERLTTLPFSQ